MLLKIGVFDSGLGGLTVAHAMTKVIKGADIFYIADTKNAPYGEKTPEQILQFSLNITKYLIDTHNIDALILACNTATSAAIEKLREVYPSLIIIGTEPGIKPAIEQTKTGKIGVLATPATLQGNKYQKLVNTLSLDKSIAMYEQACYGLVEQIEKGETNSMQTNAMLEKWLAPMREANVDTIVLGCTHYPLISQNIEHIMGQTVKLVHTGDAISRHLLALSSKKGHKNEGDLYMHIYVTGKINMHMVSSIIDTYESICFIEIENN
ncbi:glutamate racemase [Sulfurovum sp.]|uniref:glutamate racemase n=1 Tax=Sulfurovum sp. TaxID=1969726 RepID=UPI002867F331|nr:glutamate racemase [Sulfurovum sp.]